MKKIELEAINNFAILVDTREQLPYTYPNAKTQMLPYGDYTVEHEGRNYIDQIVIDRKGAISELYQFAGSERGRFVRELERMKDVKYKYILCEFDFGDIAKFDYGKVTPGMVYATIMSFQIKYGVPTLFYGNRVSARGAVFKLCQFFTKYEILGMKE